MGYWLASLGTTSELPTDIIPFLVIVLGLLIGTHFAIRAFVPFADGLMFPLVALLNGLGYMMIARLDPDLASKQAFWTFIGLAVFVFTIVFFRDIRFLEPFRYTLAALGVVLLLLPLTPGIGQKINGAQIWIKIGSLSIQPGEIAKLVLAAFLASYLAEKKEFIALEVRRIGPVGLPAFKYFAPLIFACGITLLVMVFQKDLGSSLLFFTLFLVMVYVATGRSIYVFSGMFMFAGGAFFAWSNFSHVRTRVSTWLDPYLDVKGAGYQISEAQFAIADGGLTGTGLGLGYPKKIPVVESDMIFAAFAEELGLLGATSLLLIFLLFVSCGIRIALSAASEFERLLATGLILLLGFQAFIIIGGTLRVLPLTGVTLPFVSYGGSSLIVNYMIVGIMMRVSHNSVVAATNEIISGLDEGSDSKWKAVSK